MELKQKPNLNFDKLLEPYTEGGTRNSPVKRTIGTMTSKLMISHRFPPEIVGAAIYKVFWQMAHNNLEFKGDGTYGSKGRELFSCIKAQCLDLTQQQCVEKAEQTIYKYSVCMDKNCRFRQHKMEKPDLKWAFKRYFGMRSGWFSVIVTISPLLAIFGWALWRYTQV